MLIAILFSYAVFYNVTHKQLTKARIFINATIMGLGVSAMHYTGMEAMQMDGELKRQFNSEVQQVVELSCLG